MAARVWGGEISASFWQRFRSDQRASLRWAWQTERAEGVDQTFSQLQLLHEAQARPDLARVHVSWWVQSLKNEPRSVQRAVAANAPQEIASALRDGLNVSEAGLRADSPPHAIAVQTALALWTLRLVGDLAERDDDPPVIRAISRLDTGAIARLIHTAGLAKWALIAGQPPGLVESDQPRLEWLRGALSELDLRFSQVVQRDLEAKHSAGPQAIARAGLTTFARLLGVTDLYRARWALQHLPYSTARSIRALMGPEGHRTPMLARWEGDLLRSAMNCLRVEGRIGAEVEESA